jgi:hypothetical protein
MRAQLITLLAFAVASTALAADDSVGAAAQGANADLLGNVDFAVDRDGVHVSGVRLGGVHACGAFLDQLGFAATAARDAHPGPIRDTSSFASALARQAAAAKSLKAEAGFLQVGGRT